MSAHDKEGTGRIIFLAKLIAFGAIAALAAAFVLVAIFDGLGIDTNLTNSSGNELTGNDLAFVLTYGTLLVAVGFAAGRRR